MTLDMGSGVANAYWYLLCFWAFISFFYLIHLTSNGMNITIPIFRDDTM